MPKPFPTAVYKSPGPHAGPPVNGKSTSYTSKAVRNADDLAAALRDGWHASLPEAVGLVKSVAPAAKEAPPADDAPPSRAELEQKAHELGLKVDGRMSDRKLAERIAEVLAAKE